MQKNRVFKFSLLIEGLLLAIIFMVGGVFSFNLSNKTYYANSQTPVNAAIKKDSSNNIITDDSVFTVHKVLAEDKLSTDTVDANTALHTEEDVIEEIIYNDENNIPFVMLDTSQTATDPIKREALYIEFGVSGSPVRIFAVNIRLNGTSIYANEWQDASDEISSTNQYYKQYLHGLTEEEVTESNLHDSYNTRYLRQTTEPNESAAGEVVDNVEGLYDIEIQYRFGNESAARTVSFKFYLITQYTYEQINQAPTFNYTEKISFTTDDAVVDENGYAKRHYFKYTNLYTSTTTGGTFSNPVLMTYTEALLPETLHYPTLTYNPEKYRIQYTKTLYNTQQTVQINFTTAVGANNQEYGVVTTNTYQTNQLIDTKTERIEKVDNQYLYTIQFKDVGEYNFSKTCILRTGVGSYVEANSIFLSDNNLLKNELLSITGFQAIYSKNGSSQGYLEDYSYDVDSNGKTVNAYLSDFTFMNNAFVAPQSTIVPGTNNVDLESKNPLATNVVRTDLNSVDPNTYATKIASTNQAPVWFEYNADLNPQERTSWYIHYDTNGNRTTGWYNKSTYFVQAGIYVVNISFVNPVYTGNEISGTSQNISYFNQIFVFEITNVPPVVTINTTSASVGTEIDTSAINLSTLAPNGYTNKNVYLNWNQQGPFDADITATYSLKNFDGNYEVTPESNTPFYGLVTKTLNDVTTIKDVGNTTICTRNGFYTVTIYYTNSKQTFLTLSFVIDKMEITGIKALEVNNSTKQLQNADSSSSEPFNLQDVLISDTSVYGFNLTTTKSFIWTWDTKASGASITAQYTQASLNTIANFVPTAIENGTQVWVTADGEFGNFLTLMPYSYTKVTSENANQIKFSQSQICSTPSFNILLLSDEAGNKAMFITVIENTSPELIQQIPGQEPQDLSVISETTKFTWGTHKALSINTDENKSDIIDLLSDNEQNLIADYSTNFSAYNRIVNELNSKISNQKIIVPIDEVTFTGSGGSMGGGSASSDNTTQTITFNRNGNETIGQTFIWVVVDKVEEYCTYLSISNGEPYAVYENTKIYLNANLGESGEGDLPEYYTYTINVKDASENEMLPRTVEVNFDKSRGTIFSHYGSILNDGIDDQYSDFGIRARLQQQRSTNRQYVTFSFRQQPSNSIFEVVKVELKFYQLTYDINSSNYPYSENFSEETIYDVNTTNPLFTEVTVDNPDGSQDTYYHSSALRYLNYSSSFGGSASQDGMYVITRYYDENRFNEAGEAAQEGDTYKRTYTFYVDRTKIISSNIDNDVKLTIGYDKGDYRYGNYTDYGGYIFNEFSRSIISSNEWTNNFKTTIDDFISPSAYPVISTNILPVGTSLLTKTSPSLSIEIANKFQNRNLTSVENAETIMQNLVDKYQSMNMMVLVQYFRNSDNALAYQSLYSHFMGESNEVTTGANRTYNLSKLNYAFSAVGNYRVFIFDLSNINGTMQGTFSDIELFTHAGYAPNYVIINFNVKEQAPSITFQQKTGSSEYVTANTYTKTENLRVTFSDGSNELNAKIAYNDVRVQRTLFSMYNEGGTQQTTVTIKNPTYTILNKDSQNKVVSDGQPLWVTDDIELYNEKIAEDVNIFYSPNYEILNMSLEDILDELNISYSNLYDYSSTSNNYVYLKKLISGFEDRFDYYIYLPQIPYVTGTNLQMDGQYDVFYQYIGNSEVEALYNASAFKGSSTIYIDNTAPYRTLRTLIQNDKYLQATNRTNEVLNSIFDATNPFLEEYAFAVDINWRPDSYIYGQTEADEYYFVRGPYDKYDYSSNEYQQTAVPGTPAYNNPSYSIQFSETDSRFRRINFGNSATRPFTVEGYYDIIEKDVVGNYRVYSVYVKENLIEITANNGEDNEYRITEITSGNEAGSTITLNGETLNQYGDTSPAQSISSAGLTISNIATTDKWFTIQYSIISDGGAGTPTTFNVTPHTDIEDFLNTINQAIHDLYINNQYLTGCKIEFTILNREGLDVKFNLKTPGQKLMPTFTPVNTTTFRMQMPTNTVATQIVDFSATLSDGTVFEMPEPISTNPNVYLLNYLTSGNYIFNFTDNFGNTYRVTYPIDTSLIKELLFDEGATVQVINGVTYTLGTTTFRYQSGTFTNVHINIINKEDNDKIVFDKSYTSINEILNDAENKYFTATVDNNTGIARIVFNAIDNIHYQYLIEINDGSASNEYSFNFAIYTYLPEILLTDTSGVPIWEEMSEKTTSKDVMITWDDVSDKQFNPRVSIQLPNGTSQIIESGFVATEEGTYIVRVLSDLGVSLSKTITFNIQAYEISIFGVYVNGELLTPHQDASTYTFMFQGETITETMTQYFFSTPNSNASNWDNVRPTRNEDKDLDMELAATLGNTRIYYVSGSTSLVISEFYAITMVPVQSTSLTTMTIDDEDQTQSSSKVVTIQNLGEDHYALHAQNQTCSLCAPAINIRWTTTYTDTSYSTANPFVYSNFIYLDLYYNGIFVGTYTEGALTITESGTYTIQIRNFVGQQHYFNTTYQTYTLTVLYDIIYRVNDESPIQNAVYNGDVSISLHDTSFYTMTTYTVTVYKNNVELGEDGYSVSNNVYTFNTPGVYKVLMSVRLRGSQTMLYNEANFVILNNNEARIAYEFTKISGYTITKVEKLNTENEWEDITQTLIADGQNYLSNVLLSAGTTGLGQFRITVRTSAQELIPSQTFTFNVWINNETPILTPSRDFGTNDTSSVTIQYNEGLIYNQIGNCTIVVNDNIIATINAQASDPTTPKSFTLSTPNTYFIQVYTESGQLVLSQRITIDVPLNTASIILIVVACVVVVGVTVTFLLLRNRMKVR